MSSSTGDTGRRRTSASRHTPLLRPDLTKSSSNRIEFARVPWTIVLDDVGYTTIGRDTVNENSKVVDRPITECGLRNSVRCRSNRGAFSGKTIRRSVVSRRDRPVCRCGGDLSRRLSPAVTTSRHDIRRLGNLPGTRTHARTHEILRHHGDAGWSTLRAHAL